MAKTYRFTLKFHGRPPQTEAFTCSHAGEAMQRARVLLDEDESVAEVVIEHGDLPVGSLTRRGG
ncbi:MAG: hypothetical protein AB7J28_13850 [Hyphomonadaceae bacterium]